MDERLEMDDPAEAARERIRKLNREVAAANRRAMLAAEAGQITLSESITCKEPPYFVREPGI